MQTDHDQRLFFFDPAVLDALAAQFGPGYSVAQPYPHTVIDDLLPEWVISRILDEFPTPESEGWFAYKNINEVKLELTNQQYLGHFTRHILSQFNSAEFVQFLERLTGIIGLIPDPYFDGGGLHQIQRGGFLSIHADFNKHANLDLDRRLNVILYLNRNWKEEYGGQLELWDPAMSRSERKIVPLANRCVVFSTTSTSFHGHPDPLECPPDMTRKSVALYYYTNGRSDREQDTDAHNTVFKNRPGSRSERVRMVKAAVGRWIPPAIMDIYNSRKARAAK